MACAIASNHLVLVLDIRHISLHSSRMSVSGRKHRNLIGHLKSCQGKSQEWFCLCQMLSGHEDEYFKAYATQMSFNFLSTVFVKSVQIADDTGLFW